MGHVVHIDVSAVAPAGGESIAVEVHMPESGRPEIPLVWWCLPGGGMSRLYWDLDVPANFGNYSMAKHMVAAGFAAVTVDHLGVGESSRPDDGFTLNPQVLADVNAYAWAQVMDGLRAGTLVDGLPAQPELRSIGVGHSTGASLTVHQQARHRSHAAIALLGYGGRGLPSHLSDDEKTYIDDPERLRRDIVQLVQTRYDDPLPMMPRGSSEFLVAIPMEEPVHAALVEARTNLLALAGFSSMIPGNASPEMATIEVPVFVGLGDKDIGESPYETPGEFTASHDITLFVLDESGHNHNVSPNRERLWNRLVAWARTVT